MSRKIVFLIGLVSVILTQAACAKLETRTTPLQIEKQAPEFALADHRGTKFTLEGLLQDGPAVLIFYRGYW